ncbi:hypothetical protein SVAN01_04900 [Stagonosporopsis vannaccii]|nr:hypothetical protein SVAN01_04900 [Stagonosporopsis vannaccii]
MASIAKNNAFGAGCPSWNLNFPDGNLTVSEILAYLPHWLKSVDVILRMVNHGGRSVIITHLLNKYRKMPTTTFAPNSTTVMIHYAMRRVGKPGWTIGSRGNFENDREYDEDSLYVGDFRPPRLTHPKSASSKYKMEKEKFQRNWVADPVPFKDLALHVKEHPSGDDALDLTRCVDYALRNSDEEWLFPDDFAQLVEHLGGPLPVTHSHLDRQLFERYNHLYAAHKAVRSPVKRKADESEPDADEGYDNGEGDSEGDGELSNVTAAESKPKPKRKKPTHQVFTNANSFGSSKFSAMAATSAATVGKSAPNQVDSNHDGGVGKRRSSRRVKNAPVYAEKDEDATDIEAVDADYVTPHKKRMLTRIPPTPNDEESDFEAKDEPESEDELLPVDDEVTDDADFGTPTFARGRRTASRKARKSISEQSSAALMEQFRAAAAAAKPAHPTHMHHDPELMAAARAYNTRGAVFVQPPVLSANRMVIDPFTVYIYAQEGCRNEDELWASALSFYRFGGPRRHAPFRELYCLTDPLPWDTSDWAENVRWAKEQYLYFNVETWTEYDDHLDQITQWRRQSLWVSEEVVLNGYFEAAV